MNNIGIRADALDEESFECFANDLCSGIFGKKIHGFSRGRDSGIDGIDDIKNPSIIIQAKRWTPSKRSAYYEINTEIEKIRKTIHKMQWRGPIKYVVVTSAGLSPSVQANLRKNNVDLLSEENCLLDAARINQYASDQKLQDIFRKYCLIDANLAMVLKKDRINSLPSDYLDLDPRYFVETDFFDRAFRIVINKHILLVHGNPGVGKTTLCKMLGHVFANRYISKFEQAIVMWRSPDEMSQIVRDYDSNFRYSETLETNKQFFVVIDDFLGSNSLTTDSSQMQSLTRLVNRVRQHENLFIVLNSRTQILESARNEFQDFFATMHRGYTKAIEMLEMSDYTPIDKARLLRMNLEREYSYLSSQEREVFEVNYQHLRESCYTTESGKSKNQKIYNFIISHRNFNPRLIEHISQKFNSLRYRNPSDLLQFIQQVLDNPTLIYDPLFNRMQTDEKWILLCLYTFGEKTIPEDTLMSALEPFVSTTFDPLPVLRNMEYSWLKFEKAALGEIKVGYVNPSIRDYFTAKNKTINFTEEIKKKATLICQLDNFLDRATFNSVLLSRWADFRDQDEYLGEHAVASLSAGCTYKQANGIIQKLLASYEGTWHFGESCGWSEVFSAIESSNLEIADRTSLRKQLFESLIDETSSTKHFTDILNSVRSMDSFDNIIDFFLPEIKRKYNIDIENVSLSSIDKDNKGYELINEICVKKQGLIQSSIDGNYEDYYFSALDEVVQEIPDHIIIDDVFDEIFRDSFGKYMALYDDLDNFDYTVIAQLVDEVRDEIMNEDEMNNSSDNSYVQRSNHQPVTGYDEENREIDKIMDRPINQIDNYVSL